MVLQRFFTTKQMQNKYFTRNKCVVLTTVCVWISSSWIDIVQGERISYISTCLVLDTTIARWSTNALSITEKNGIWNLLMGNPQCNQLAILNTYFLFRKMWFQKLSLNPQLVSTFLCRKHQVLIRTGIFENTNRIVAL